MGAVGYVPTSAVLLFLWQALRPSTLVCFGITLQCYLADTLNTGMLWLTASSSCSLRRPQGPTKTLGHDSRHGQLDRAFGSCRTPPFTPRSQRFYTACAIPVGKTQVRLASNAVQTRRLDLSRHRLHLTRPASVALYCSLYPFGRTAGTAAPA